MRIIYINEGSMIRTKLNTKYTLSCLAVIAAVSINAPALAAQSNTTIVTSDQHTQVSSTLLQQKLTFDITAGSLASSLKLFSQQTGLQLFYRHNLVAGKTNKAIKGKLTVQEALEKLLGNSLRFVIKNNRTLAILSIETKNVIQAVENISQALDEGDIEHITVIGGIYKGYAEHNPTSGTKLDTQWLKVAQSVSVITKQEIADKGAIRLGQVLDGVSGVNATLGEGARDQFVIRGFDALLDTYRDGMRDDASYQAYRSLANIERVEVVKGAAGALYGRGSAGGLINLITKKADGRSIQNFSLSVNSEGSLEGKADLGSELSDNVNGRVNLAYRKGERFMNNSDYDDFFIAPVLRTELSDNTRLDVEVEYLTQKLVPYRGVPSIDGLPVNLGAKTNLSGTNDYQHLDSIRGGATLTHHFTDELTWLNRVAYSHINLKQKGTRNSAPVDNKMSQSVVNFGFDPQTTLTFQSELTWQTDYNALLIGIDNNNLDRETISAGARNARIIDLNEPQSGPTSNPGFKPNRNNQVNSTGLYVQDVLNLGDFSVLAGLRFDKFTTKQTPAQQDSYSINHDELSPRFGLVYQVNEAVSTYITSGRSYQLPWGGGYMKSTKAKMMKSDLKEIGVKAYLLDESLMLNTAIFSINREDPVTNDIGLVVDYVDAEHNGFEIEMRGQINQAWNISAGYSYLDATDKKTNTKPNDVSDQLFSVWTDYQFNSGLSLGGGVHYVGDRYAGNEESVRLKAYTLLAATAAYQWDKHNIRINLNNITDKDYFVGATSGGSGKHQIGYGAPRNIQLTYSLVL
jgi:iron complex outermembrane receptor protein